MHKDGADNAQPATTNSPAAHAAAQRAALTRFLRGGRLTRWKGQLVSCPPLSLDLFQAPSPGVMLAVFLSAFGTLSTPAFAEQRYWDPNGTAVGSGGAGTWDTSTSRWSPNDDGVSGPFAGWDNSRADDAIFTGVGGAVTLGAPISVHNLRFTGNGYTLIGGNPLTLTGVAPTITTDVGGATIGATIAGTAGLTKAGAGTLFLTGANTFSGGVNVNAGTLNVNSNAALGDAGNVVTMNAGTLSASGSLQGRTINLVGAAPSVQGAGVGDAHYTGSGGVQISAGVTMKDDTNDFTGQAWFWSNGAAAFTSVRDYGQASSLGAGSGPNGTIRFTSALQYADSVSYVGTGDNSNRDWVIDHFTSGSSPSGTVFANGGTGALNISGNISVASSSPIAMTFRASTSDLGLTGTISSPNAARLFRFDGGGSNRTITLGGANTFAGPASIGYVTVKAATLANAGANSSLGAGSTVLLTDNGVLSYTGAGATTDRTWTVTAATAAATLSNDGTGALSLTGPVNFDAAAATDTLTLGGSFTGADNTISGSIAGNGDLVSDGAGTWVLSGNNTRTGKLTVTNGTLRAGSATAFGTTTDVRVDGGTLDLGGHDLSASSLNGNGGTVALGGGDLSLNVVTGASSSYAGSIQGAGNLIKDGGGTLTLSGANAYTGTTQINGGTLALDFSPDSAPASNILASTSTVTMSGGSLLVTGDNGESNTQELAGLTVNGGSNTVGAVAGTGGSVTLDLGTITHNGGLVDFRPPTSGNIKTDSAALGGWATVNGSDYAKVEAGNIVAFTESDYTDMDNAASWGAGQYITDVDGFFGTVGSTVQLAGLRYTAPVSTTVTVTDGQTLGVDGTIIVAPSVGANDQTITGGTITGTAGGGILGVQQNSDGNFTIASQITDNQGASVGFTKGGTGRVTLDNASNSYTGGTTIAGGTLSVDTIANGGGASSIGASGPAASNLIIQGATLEYTGDGDVSDRSFTIARSGSVANATIAVSDPAARLEFGGVVTSADGAGLTKTGPGTLVLSNGGSDYTGPTTINGGTLEVGTLANGGTNSSIGASSNASSNLVLQDGGRLAYAGGTNSSDRGFTLTNGGGIGVMDGGATLTVSGTATGSGGFTKTGGGTLILSGTNDYTGGTTISAGTLRAGSAKPFGTGPVTVNSGATLDIADIANVRTGGLGGDGTLNLGVLSTTRYIMDGTGNTFSGIIGGAGGVTLGSGAQTFSGCKNTYAGPTTIWGTLNVSCLANGGEVSDIGTSDADAGNLVLAGGTLNYTGNSVTTDRGFTTGGWIGVANSNTTLTFQGQAVGGGQLVKLGAGTLLLSGNNTYSGGTTIQQGILRAGSTSAFGTGALIVNAGTADLANFSNTVLSLGGAGNVTLGSGTLGISHGQSRTFSGAISGSGGLVKTGAGSTQVLSGSASSYTGATTISGGTLVVHSLKDGGVNSSIGASLADAGNLVLNGGTLSYAGTGDSTNRQFTLGAGGGTLDASGSGAVRFTSTAATALDGAGSRTLTLSGTNTANNSLAAQITDEAGGTTALTKTGTGTWVLENANSDYSGPTTISGGVLAVTKLADGNQASSIGDSSSAASNLVIGNGSTLRYTGAGDTTDRQFTLDVGTTFIESSGTGALVFDNTGPVTLTGTDTGRTIALGGTNTGNNTMGGTMGDNGTGKTVLAKNGSGTWVLTGNNSYSGNTVVNDGTLVVGNGGTSGNVGTGNVIVFAGTSTLAVNRSDTFNINGTLSGAGALSQIGTGTTVLASTGNSIGATRVGAGTLQVDGSLASATIGMTGTSALTVNGTMTGTAGAAAALTGDAGANTITVGTAGLLRATGDLGDGADTVNVAGTLDSGGTALSLGAGNDTLRLNDGATLAGTGVTGGGGADTLAVNNAAALTLDGARISAFETLNKQNSGVLTLTGNHAYSSGTIIDAGTLQIGNGTTTGTLAGNIANNGTLAFNRSDAYTFAGTISGSGVVNQVGTGTTTLTGTNTYTGATNVQSGTLLVNGNQSGATGMTSVASGATLGGIGTIGGAVTVADGGTLSPGNAAGAPGTLSINGGLQLGPNANLNVNFGEANVVGGQWNDLVNVGGNLTLDGTINVSQSSGGNFGPGIYRVISYAGALNDQGATLSPSSGLSLQTSIANQVNLVNSTGLSLNFWDGDAGPKNNAAVNGGSGTWRATGDTNWTGEAGTINGDYANGSFAIFAGTAGTVTVDNGNGAVQASGMQFASDGYRIQGDDIALTGTQATMRVGDGSSVGAGYTATVASNLSGTSELVKTDQGRLVLEGANTYTGGTRIEGGTVSIAADANLGDASGGLTLNNGTLQTTADLSSARAVTLEGNGTMLTDAGTTATLNGGVAGLGALTKDGAGTLALAGDATHTGGTSIAAGTLQVGAGGTSGSLAGNVLNNGTLAFNRTDTVTFDGTIAGSGALRQAGSGITILSADHSYSGGTTIEAGTLQLGNGGSSGMIAGDVTTHGRLAFNRADTVTFGGTISGTGGVSQDGTGTTILTAANHYGGTTTVNNGTLLIQGDQSGATGSTTVNAGTLGGTGIIGGDVTVVDGASVAPGGTTNVPGTLTINGDLTLASAANMRYDFGQAGVVGGAYNDLIEVGGDLTLGGTLNVSESAGGNFGPGLYRVISYGGTLVNNPVAVSSPDYFLQTSIDKQVNLVNTAGLALNYWDGDAGGRNDGQISGGNGTWQAGLSQDNWTTDSGNANAPFQDQSFAVFAGNAGTVTVDDSQGNVNVAGMQFATDGYRIEGDAIGLSGTQATIRVGDGTVDGAGYTATIASNLSGGSELVKTDLGKLVLEGTNTYFGGTRIDGGTVSISADANLGDASGGLTLNGGTLQTTADLSSGRTVTLASNGTILTDAGTTATFGGAMAGAGALTKDGTGTLALAGDATHTGGTTIAAGTLQVGTGGTTGSLAGNVTNNGTLAFNRTDTVTFDGTISGTGALRQSGSGTTIVTAEHSYSGGTMIEAGTLQLGNGGTSGMIAGDVTNNGTLAFNRADTLAFNGTISGTGGVSQDGAGTTILTAANSYGGTTTVNNGTLLIQGDQSLATGATTVNAGTLGGSGIIGGDVSVASGAKLAPGSAAGNPGTLTINGNLALQAGSALDVDFGRANTVGGPLNDLVEVAGDLSLGGTLNVKTAAGGAFGPGVYRVISYGGNLLGGTLGLGSLPTGSRATVQTSIDKQVNLVNASNNALNFWDGDAGGRGDGRITGGDGVWRASGDDNWTEADGGTNAAFGNGGFAVFAGTAGKVTVDNSQGQVEASGMQFASDGYTVEGDRIALTGTDATIRVGDGTADGANYVATINAALSGTSGLTKTDAGTLVLGGTSDYTGATTVAGGTLTVNGAIASSPVSVQQGAALAGTGTVGLTTVAAGATVAPAGNGSGTLTVNGNYVQQADGVYQAHVDPTSSASDRIAVSGSATLAEGARLNVTKTSNAAYVAGTRYAVLSAAGGLHGAFTLTGDTAVTAFMGLRGDYDANNAYLVVQQARAIDSAGQTPNQIAAGRGVDSLAGDNPLKTAVLNLTDDAAARNAFDQLSGEIHASIRTASIEESRFVRDAATDRLREAFCAVGSEGDRRDARGGSDCGPESSRPSGWVRVFGAWGSHDGNGNAGAMDSSTGGILLGADSAVSQNWRVGVLAGYSHTNVDVDSRHSSGSIDNYHAGIYGGGQWGALGLRTGAAYTWQDIGTSRSVNFAGFRDHAKADYRAGMAQVFGDLGYRIDAGRYSYEPFVNVAHVNLDTRGFDEQGGAAALASPGNTSDVTFSTLGLRTTADISLGRLTGTLRGSLGWRHAFGDRTPMSTLAMRGGDQFGVAGVPIADDAAVVNAGLDIKVGKATTMGLSYSGQFAGNSRAQTVKASLKVLF